MHKNTIKSFPKIIYHIFVSYFHHCVYIIKLFFNDDNKYISTCIIADKKTNLNIESNLI